MIGREAEDEDIVAEVFGDLDSDQGKADEKELPEDKEEGAEVESTRARGIRQPTRPSLKEIEGHNLTHAEYRDWCEEIVEGKGRRDQHRRKDEEKEVEIGSGTTFAIDYMHLTEEFELITEKEAEEKKLKLGKPILVGHDRRTGAVVAHQV